MNYVIALLGAWLLCVTPLVQAHQHPVKEEAVVGAPALKNAKLSSSTFDHKGRLWSTWAQGGVVYVSYSDDVGKNFSAPVVVNQDKQTIQQNGESRPLIAVDNEGRIFVAWNEALTKRFSGNVRFTRSTDGGKTFEPSRIINDNRDEIGHSFVSMLLDAQGIIHLVWLDARDAAAAKAKNETYVGSSLYYSRSENHGESFSRNRKLADNTCQCCRIALTLDDKQQPLIMWRHVFADSQRDHALLRLDGEMQRITFENWQTDSCPHHGPSISVAANGKVHMAWFNQAKQPALYYGNVDKDERSKPVRFSDGEQQAQHPVVLSVGDKVYLAWKTFDGKQNSIRVQTSSDQGATWSKPRTVASSKGESDHPALLSREGKVYLAWQSQPEGLRLIGVDSE